MVFGGAASAAERSDAWADKDQSRTRSSDDKWDLIEGALVGRTTRIRRRRAGSVDDATDAIRAVACIRFVRPWLAVGVW